jgi:tetratricopeptide (TPR) repeat protein
VVHLDLKQYEPAIADLETAFQLEPDQRLFSVILTEACRAGAWQLATGPEPRRDLDRALALARRAVELSPRDGAILGTLGVVLYRAGRYAESRTSLEQSLAAGYGPSDGDALFFLAMAHHRLGHRDAARAHFDRALRWMSAHPYVVAPRLRQLAAFRAEAEALLAGPAAELPEDVFAGPATVPVPESR